MGENITKPTVYSRAAVQGGVWSAADFVGVFIGVGGVFRFHTPTSGERSQWTPTVRLSLGPEQTRHGDNQLTGRTVDDTVS